MPILPVNPPQPTNPAAQGPYAQWGTLSIADLLRVNNQSVIDFGPLNVFQVLQQFYAFFNVQVNEQIGIFTEKTPRRVQGVSGPVVKRGQFTDEYGVADVSKMGGVGQMGFPLRKHQVNTQWSYQWMRKHTPAEMVKEAQASTQTDLALVQYSLRKAIFTPTDSTFVDTLTDYMTLFVKAFANADGFPLPPSPNGTTFDATIHSHYVGTTNPTPNNADLGSLLRNVAEHFAAGQLFLYVTQDVGDALLAGAGTTYPDFAKLQYTDQQYATTLTLGRGNLEPVNAANRQIGVFRGAQVWVKPWVPPQVTLAFIVAPGMKPVAFRVPDDLGGDDGNFRPIFNDDQYPTMCEFVEREYGFGVQNRVAGAVLSYNGPDTTYVAPTYTV